jgi:hypothetical protein
VKAFTTWTKTHANLILGLFAGSGDGSKVGRPDSTVLAGRSDSRLYEEEDEAQEACQPRTNKAGVQAKASVDGHYIFTMES